MPTTLGHANNLSHIWNDFHIFARNIQSEGLAWRWYADKIHQLSLIVVQQLRDPICLLLIAGMITSYNSHARHRRAWLRKMYGPPTRIKPKRRPALTTQGRLHRLQQAGILIQPD